MENNRELVEKLYSSSINKFIIQGLSQITGLVSFSLAEFIYISHLIAIPIVFCILIYKLFKGEFFKYTVKIVSYLSVVYLLFMILWGFNYSRVSISETMSLEVLPLSTEKLYDLNQDLIIKANTLRQLIHEDESGVMTIEGGYQSVFNRANTGYQLIGEDYQVLAGRYGRPKSIKLSQPMLYTGITGMYFPFTAEANVNTAIPYLLLPATTLHEMAHLRGIASEDEANYLAYLTASVHPDVDFQYSGTVLALIYTLNALATVEPDLASELKEMYSEGLKRDLQDYNEFWSKYDGQIDQISNRVNDAFLKGNRQEDGVISYSRMVYLLMSHYEKYEDI